MNQPSTPILACSLFVALCCVRHAQAQVSATATVAIPTTASASSAGTTQTSTMAAGPLISPVWLSAYQYPAITLFTQGLAVSDSAVELECTMLASLDGSLGPAVGSASCGPSIVDLQLSTSSPISVVLEVDFLNQSDPGAPTPGFTIDIGNDGFLEHTNGQWSSPASQFLLLDTQPTTLRVTSWAAVSSQGTARARATLRVKPSHTVVSPPLVGTCGATINVLPTFTATGIDVFAVASGGPTVVIFGFAPQPVLLPGQPCLLYPQLDVVIPAPSVGPLSIPLPATVRPFQVWVQAVGISPMGLGSSSAHTLYGV